MRLIAAPTSEAAGVVFLGRLMRLLEEVEEINRQLERVEAEVHQTLNAAARERFEEYR